MTAFNFHWRGYGGVWKRYEPQAGDRVVGECDNCGQHCGHDFFRFGDQEHKSTDEHVEYTVSDGRSVVVQGIKDEPTARLMAAAPDLFRLLNEMAESDPMHHDYDDYGDWEECAFCGATPDSYPGQDKFVPHDVRCLWRRVRERLAELEKPLHVWGYHDVTVSGLEE